MERGFGVISVLLAVAGIRAARADLSLPYVAQGRTQFITSNTQAWFARYHLLKNARSSILIATFRLRDDVFGESILALLIEKARAGLEVKLLVDARGTFGMTHDVLGRALLREAVKAGVVVKVFNPLVAGGITRDLPASVHQKILLVDDQDFLTGGRNFGQEYFLDENDLPATAHDADVLIDSTQIAAEARQMFLAQFESTTAVRLRDTGTFGNVVDHAPRLFASLAAMEDRLFHIELKAATLESHPELARWIWLREFQPWVPFEGPSTVANADFDDVNVGEQTTAELNTLNPVTLLANGSRLTPQRGPLGHDHAINAVVLQLLAEARDEILIENPYIVLQPETEAAFVAAARRGVKIVFVTNGPRAADTPFPEALMIHQYKAVLAELPHAVMFMATGRRLVHAKTMVVDRKLALVGSFNLDALSDHINAEDTVLVQSPAFSSVVANSILDEREFDSQEVTQTRGPGAIRGAGGAMRGLEGLYWWIAKLLKPVL